MKTYNIFNLLSKRFLAIMILSYLLSLSSSAQDMSPFSYDANMQPSAETWGMTRYGNEKPSLNTGAMRTSIPVYHYRDPDFDIPISLDYYFDGYRPSVHSGAVGLGWHINGTGVITRDVVGLPDELYDDGLYGYHYSIHRNFLRHFYNDEGGVYLWGIITSFETGSIPEYSNVFNNVPILTKTYSSTLPEGKYDTSSDIYHFILPGAGGDFVIKDDGTICVFNTQQAEGTYSVSFDYELAMWGVSTPKVTIVTPDGYRYEYGGDIWHVGYSCEEAEFRSGFISPTSLVLHSIEAPNGRTVEYCYSMNPQAELQYNEIYMGRSNVGNNNNLQNPIMEKKTTTVYSRLLESIKVDDNVVIKFNYSPKTIEEFGLSAFYDSARNRHFSRTIDNVNDAEKCLSSVVVKNCDGEQVDSLSVYHTYSSSSGSPKMFLSSIKGNSGEWDFTYNNSSPNSVYPKIDYVSEDHWGYWNGRSGGLPITTYTQQDNDLYNISGTSRDPVFAYSMYSALTDINYPTGGRTSIQYEMNDAGILLNKQSTCQAIIQEENTRNFPVGGVRVRRIDQYDINNVAVGNIEYLYVSPITGYSSGTLMYMPRYAMKTRYKYFQSNSFHPTVTQTITSTTVGFLNGNASRLVKGNHIEYSYIQERFPDGSYIIYHYSGWDDYEDEYESGQQYLKYYYHKFWDFEGSMGGATYGITSPYDGYEKTKCEALTMEPTIDCQNMRGLLLEESHYLADGTKMSEIINEYSLKENVRIRQIRNMLSYFDDVECTIVSPKLANKTNVSYGNGNSLSVVERMSYDSFGRLSSCIKESFEDAKIESYTYDAVFKEQISRRNVLARNGNQTDTLYVMDYRYDTESDNHSPISVTVRVGHDTKLTTVTYDSNYRPTRVNYPGGRYTEYTWSADGRRLLSSTSNVPGNTTTYQWRDLVGLTRLTMPTGQSERYGYDDCGRLESRSDSDGNMTVKYEYHLNNE